MQLSTFLLLLLLPLFNTEPIQSEFENNDDLLMQRSVAANYLFGLPMRQYQRRLVDSSLLSKASDDDNGDDDQSQQRGKRIYWENLAFHATDYNQKVKKG